MKKLLAILCTVALVATCCAVSFTALANETATTSPALYNFTTKAETDKWVGLRILEFGGNTKFEYDAEQQALKVSPKDLTKNKACQFTMGMANKTTNVADYPVIAFKVKANNRNRNTCGIWPGTKNSGQSSIYSSGDVCTSYNRTGTWELIIFDGTNSDRAGYKGQWDSIIVRLMADNDVPNDTDYTWIQWAGVFKSVDEVYAYDTSMAPSPFFYDFSDKTDAEKLMADGRLVNDAGTTIAYDATEGAAKITSTGTNANRFRIPTGGNKEATVAKYPVIAMKVKFSNPSLNFGGIAAGCDHGQGGSIYGTGYVAADIAETGDWQLIVFDGSSMNNAKYGGTWNTLLGALAANGTVPTAGDAMWIQWAGVFQTVEEACAYGKTESPFLYNFSDADDAAAYIKNGKIGAGDCKNTTVAYDATEGAIKISPKDLTAVDAARFEIRSNNAGIEVKEYPVIAIKIKTKNTTRPFGGIWPGTYNNGSTSKYKAKDVCQTYSRTGDWELLLYDGSKTTDQYYSGQWYGMIVRLMSNNITPTEDDVCWVEWAGAFKTTEEAEQYYIKSFGLDGAETSEIGDGSGKEDPSEFFYNFSDLSETVSLIKGTGGVHLLHNGGGANTVFSYDPVKRALKVSPQDFTKGTAGRFAFEADNKTTNTADYPIYALKIKVNTANQGFAGIWAGTQNNGANRTYDGPDLLNQTTHATTGDWQLIILDNTGNKGFKGQWKSALFRLLSDAELAAKTDACWVQWAGAFKTIDDVYAYADMQKPADDGNDRPVFFYDFTNKIDTNAWLGNKIIFAEGGSNTTLSYDETEKALKLGTADTKNKKAGRVSILANGTASVKEYPVMAVMVKLNNPDRALGGLLPGTDRPDGGSKFMISNVLKTYKHNNEWQLLVFDGTKFDNKYYTGNWDGFLLRLLGENAIPTAKDYCFIKWAGAFKTAKDAYAYAGMEVPPEYVDPNPSPFFYNFTQSFDTTGWIENGDVAGDGNSNTKISYDKTEKALKVEPKNYKDKNAGVVAMYARGEALNVADYPVFAMKIKTKNVSSVLNSVWAGTNSKYPTKFRVQLPIEQYNATDEWQYMVIDATGYEAYDDAYTGTWFGLITKLMDINTVPTKDDVFYIQWAGVFATADEAYAYAGIENPKKNTSSDPDGKAPTKFFWDLTKGEVINNHVSVAGDTKFEYDFAANAMKVTVTDTNDDGAVTATPGRVVLGDKIPVNTELKATDYPFIALRVKLSKDSLTGGWAHYRTTYSIEKYLAEDIDAADCQVKLLGYNPTSEWQTIIIDCTADPTAAFFFDGNWSALKLDFISEATAQEGDTVYVKWAGAFKSEKDIEDYVKLTEGNDDEAEKNDDADGKEKGKLSVVVIAIIIVAAVLVIAGGVVAGVIIFKKKRS